MTKNEAIKFAVHHSPRTIDEVLELINKLDAVDPSWHLTLYAGATYDQLQELLAMLKRGERPQGPPPEHKLPGGVAGTHEPPQGVVNLVPADDPLVKELMGAAQQGIDFAMREHNFSQKPIDIVQYTGKKPTSKFYLAKVCKNCGAGMMIDFEKIPTDIKEINKAMYTLDRIFYSAGHEDMEL